MKFVSKAKQQRRIDRKEAKELARGKECKKCGKCCEALYFHIPNLTPDIQWYYELHENATIVHIDSRAYVRIEAKCLHLTQGKLCEIHGKKPIVCRKGYSEMRKNVVFMEGCAFK